MRRHPAGTLMGVTGSYIDTQLYGLADLPVRSKGVMRSRFPQRDLCLATTLP